MIFTYENKCHLSETVISNIVKIMMNQKYHLTIYFVQSVLIYETIFITLLRQHLRYVLMGSVSLCTDQQYNDENDIFFLIVFLYS